MMIVCKMKSATQSKPGANVELDAYAELPPRRLNLELGQDSVSVDESPWSFWVVGGSLCIIHHRGSTTLQTSKSGSVKRMRRERLEKSILHAGTRNGDANISNAFLSLFFHI